SPSCSMHSNRYLRPSSTGVTMLTTGSCIRLVLSRETSSLRSHEELVRRIDRFDREALLLAERAQPARRGVLVHLQGGQHPGNRGRDGAVREAEAERDLCGSPGRPRDRLAEDARRPGPHRELLCGPSRAMVAGLERGAGGILPAEEPIAERRPRDQAR